MARPRTPPAVAGRQHADIQTETYLEELSDAPPMETAGTQTDALQDRPPSPLFVPAKSGVDAATQIQAGELFDFDLEVEPILEVLVGKTLEQGLMEVLEEEELAALRAHQEEFEQIRAAELAEVQRLEAEAVRRDEERKRRAAQEIARVKREAAVKAKVAATAYARRYLNSVRTAVFSKLLMECAFTDPLAKAVEEDFLPGVLDGAMARLAQRATATQAVDSVLAAALTEQRKQLADHRAAVAAEKARLEAEAAEREAKRLADIAAAEAAAEAARLAEEAAAAAEGEESEEEDDD